MSLTHMSIFSGIGGGDLAFDRAGFRTVCMVEIDRQAQRVLRHHWPDALLLTDVTAVTPEHLHGLGQVDVVSFGSPCQDLSVAGRQAGIEGERSGLFFDAMRIIGHVAPRITLWENVDGALTVNGGRSFAAVITALAGCPVACPAGGWGTAGVVFGPSGHVAWRVLDAQYFGLPQRRNRVFVVRDSGGECAGEILVERARSGWRPPSRSRARKGLAPAARSSTATRGADDPDRLALIPFDMAQVTSPANRQLLEPGRNAPAIHANGGPHVIIAPAVAGGQPASHGHGTGHNRDTDLIAYAPEIANTITGQIGESAGQRLESEIIAYQCQGTNVGEMGTIRAGNAGLTGGVPFIAFDPQGGGKQGSLGADQETVGAIGTTKRPAVAFGIKGSDIGYAIRAEPSASGDKGDGGLNTTVVVAPMAYTVHGTDRAATVASDTDIASAIRTKAPGSQENSSTTVIVTPEYGVRRLMPLEVARCQGFPDDWFDVPGKALSDAAKYRGVGNAMSVPVVEWIARRIAEALDEGMAP